MTVIWARAALLDVSEIQAYLEERNPQAAWNAVAQIMEAANSLQRFSKRGRKGRTKDTREHIMPGLPYVIIYEPYRNTIGILRVIHMARRWPPRDD